MTPNIPGIAYVLAGLLAIVSTVVALALVRFAEKLARFTEAVNALRITHGNHRDAIDRLAQATSELATPAPVTTLESVELVSEGCCRGPLPTATSAEDLPLIAPTPAVSREEAAAAVTRKETSRDRVRPDSVTQTAQGH